MSEKEPANWTRSEFLWGSGAALVALAAYLLTLCPSLNFIDSGELATVASTLGIAHPTGYPLFTLLGSLVAHLPLGFTVIVKLNMMSAFFAAAALLFYFKLAVYLMAEAYLIHSHRKLAGAQLFMGLYLPAAAGTLLLAFSRTYWSQGVALEVYSLHLLLVGIVLLLFAKGVLPSMRPRGRESVDARREMLYLCFFAFALGLSFSNHMTTIFLAPACLYLFFAAHRFGRDAWRKIGWMAPPFLAGLSVYLYLPLRAAEHPYLNWGNPASWDAFLRHTSAKQYSVWLFSSGETARRQLGHFLSGLPEELAYAGLVLALVGVWRLFRLHRKLFTFTLLLFLGCVLYAINYDIHDIDSYFLLAYVTVGVWASFGAREIIGAASALKVKRLAAAAALLCAGLAGALNASAVTLHDMYLVEDYTRDMFRSVEKNAVIITYQWDYFVSASYYLQRVEEVRPDVVIIDKELMRRSWYFAQLERRYPWLIANSRTELDAFMVELRKFEHDLPYNPQLIEFRFAALIKSFIEKNVPDRPVYVTPEIEPQYTAGYFRIPSGLAERLVGESASKQPQAPQPVYSFRIPARRGAYVDGIVGLYAQAYARSASYDAGLGKTDDALTLVEKALSLQPGMQGAILLRDELKKRVNKGG